MKRVMTLCVMSFLLIQSLIADNITVEEAQSLAQAFLRGQQDVRKVNGVQPSTTKDLTLAAQLSECFIFNMPQDAGYVIVAGDDIVPQPILGYADKGTFDANNMPCNLQWWLSQYEEEINWARQNVEAYPSASSSAKAPEVSKAAIEPLVQSHWNQSSPYNSLCPTVNGSATYTGCVATATAQIMRYHKHPAQGTGSHSYTWNNETLSRDFTQSTYDWDNMLLDYGTNYTSEQGEAVARLMVDVGYAVEMSYSTSGSGASSRKVATALPTYFGYSNAMQFVLRSSYGLTDWMNLIYNELGNSRPVYYAGYNTSGHAFVIDGYKQGYFHVNWGWGGTSDGYFLISALDPSQQGIGGSSSGYNSGQEAIIGIEPGNGEPVVSTPIITIDSFTPYASTISRTSYFSYYTMGPWIWNKGISTATGYMGLKVVDASGNATYLCSKGTITIQSGYGSKSGATSVSLSNFPTDQTQTYKVYPVYKEEGGDQWYDVTVSGDNDYLLATTDGSTIYFTAPTTPTITLTATNIELPTKIFTGNTFTLKTKISAKDGEYNGNIYAYTSGSESQIGSASVNVDEQTNVTVALSCTAPSTAGTHTMTLKDKDGNTIADGISYTVEDAPTGTLALTISKVEFVNTAADDLHVKVTFNCTSGYYDGQLIAFIYPQNGGSSLGYLRTNLTTYEGETTTVDFEGSFAGTVGTKYLILFHKYDSSGNRSQIDNTWRYFTLTAAGTKVATTSYENIGELIDDAYAQYKVNHTVSDNNRPSLDKVQVNFDKEENPATVVAVLKYQDTNDSKPSDVKAGYIFVVDKSERGLMLMPPTDAKNEYDDLKNLKVGDVITGQLAGYYKDKKGIPAFEVRKSVSQGSGSSKVTYTSSIETDTSGEATETEEATYPVTEIPNVHFLAKTNEQDVDGNANVGDVTKQAYGNYLNSIITVSGTIREKNGQYYLLQNEDDAVDDADLYRIYFSADEFPDIDLSNYVGATGTFEGLLIKRNITEAKLSVQKMNFYTISELYLSELDKEMRVTELVNNGSLPNAVDIYVHRTKLVAPENGYSTICLPFNLTSSEFSSAFGCDIDLLAEATQTVSNDGYQEFSSVASKNITAGKPYLLKASGTQTKGNGTSTTEDNYWTHIGKKNISVATPSTVTATYNNNIVNGEFQFRGIYGKKQYTTGDDGQPTEALIADGGSQKYQYISTTDGTLRYLPASSTLAFNGMRAYYYFPNWNADNNNAINPQGSKSALVISVDGQRVDSIDGISLDDTTLSPIYNLQGQKVGTDRSSLPKGLYIQNGVKFAIK